MSVSPAGGVAHEPEDPLAVARNLNAGARLLVSAVGFVFVAFLFAFLYLKAVNANGLWHPAHTKPSQGYGIAILVCVLASTALIELGRRALPGGAWAPGVGAALAFSVVALVLQVVQILDTGFSAYDGGGYSSVFYGWLSIFGLAWLGAVYWIETLLVTGLRRLPHPELPDADPVALLRPSADALAVYLYLLGAVAVIFYILLYLVK